MAELSFDRIISINAENDKNTSLNMGVWQGNASLTVFANRAQAARIPMSRTFQVALASDLQKLLGGKPNDKNTFNFTKWDPDTKKSNPLGSVVVGRDDKAMIYIGVVSPGHSPMKFVLKSPISFDKSEPMSDIQRSELATLTLIAQLTVDIPHAILLTSFKRDMGRGAGTASNNNTGIRDSDVSIF